MLLRFPFKGQFVRNLIVGVLIVVGSFFPMSRLIADTGVTNDRLNLNPARIARPVARPQISLSTKVLVRGYLAAAIGTTADAERGGLYSHEISNREVYLPGVEVFLENIRTHDRAVATTDLSPGYSSNASPRAAPVGFGARDGIFLGL